MKREVTNFFKFYCACQLCATLKNRSHDHDQPVSCVFDTLSMHFVWLFLKTKIKYRYILLSIEHPTGWINACLTAGQSSYMEISFYKREVINQFGSSSVILTDQSPALLLTVLENALKLEEKDTRGTATYSIRSDGREEKMIPLPVIVKDVCGKGGNDRYGP